MGCFQHHVLIVIGDTQYDPAIRAIHQKAQALMPDQTTGLHFGSNGMVSFAVLPDGSKEGWDRSNEADEAREEIKKLGSYEAKVYEVSMGELGNHFTHPHPDPDPGPKEEWFS